MNHYEILKVKSSASQDEIKVAYKALIKKYHPDIYPGDKTFAERKTAAINAAYDVLSNPETRAQYDSEIFSVHDCNATSSSTRNTSENYSDYYKNIDPNYYTNRYRQRNSNTYNSYSNTYTNRTNNTYYQSQTSQKFDKKYQDVREKVITYTTNLDVKRKISLVILIIIFIFFLIAGCTISLFNDLSTIMYMNSDSYINNKVQEYRNTTTIPTDNDYPNETNKNIIQPPPITSNVIHNSVMVGDSPTHVLQKLGSPDSFEDYTSYFVWIYPTCYVYFDRSTNSVLTVLTDMDYSDFFQY